MNEHSVKITIPIKNGDIETAYDRASDARQELELFFDRLREAVYYRDNMPQCEGLHRRFGYDDDGNGVLVVEAVWVGPDWTAEAVSEFTNTYVVHQNNWD